MSFNCKLLRAVALALLASCAASPAFAKNGVTAAPQFGASEPEFYGAYLKATHEYARYLREHPNANEQERAEKHDELFAEAEKIYRKMVAETQGTIISAVMHGAHPALEPQKKVAPEKKVAVEKNSASAVDQSKRAPAETSAPSAKVDSNAKKTVDPAEPVVAGSAESVSFTSGSKQASPKQPVKAEIGGAEPVYFQKPRLK